jgi:hypothetical protein
MNRLRSINWGVSGLTIFYQVVAADMTTQLIPRTSSGVVEFPANSGNYQYNAVWDPTWASGTEIWDNGSESVSQIFNAGQLAIEDEVNPSEITASIKSYSTVAQANAYFADMLYTNAWDTKTDNQKQQALNSATRIIDLFDFIGTKTLSTQPHEWPRQSVYLNSLLLPDSDVPQDIIIAQYEIALALAKGIDPEREIRSARITSRGYSSVRTTYDPRLVPEHLMYGVPSALAWSYLSTYFNRSLSGIVRLHRVN